MGRGGGRSLLVIACGSAEGIDTIIHHTNLFLIIISGKQTNQNSKVASYRIYQKQMDLRVQGTVLLIN